MEFEMLETETNGTIIKVVGVGGAGGNAVQHMINRGVQGVDFIVMNTDAQALSRSRASSVIQLGNTGLGAGAKPEMGRAAAEEARERIADALRGAHMVFITAGMGGGTGTGAAPVVAQIAKEMGILTVGVVSKPFEFEGGKRMRVAEAGSQQLEDHVDSLIVVLNDKLFDVMGDDAEMDKCFQCADDVLNNAVAGIAEIINVDGLVNVDFEDVKTVMGEQGKAMMGTATVARRAGQHHVEPFAASVGNARSDEHDQELRGGRCDGDLRCGVRRRDGRCTARDGRGDGSGPCGEEAAVGTDDAAAHGYGQPAGQRGVARLRAGAARQHGRLRRARYAGGVAQFARNRGIARAGAAGEGCRHVRHPGFPAQAG